MIATNWITFDGQPPRASPKHAKLRIKPKIKTDCKCLLCSNHNQPKAILVRAEDWRVNPEPLGKCPFAGLLRVVAGGAS